MNSYMRQYTEKKAKEAYDHLISVVKDEAKHDEGFISFQDILRTGSKCGYSQPIIMKIIKRAEEKGVIKIFKDEFGQKHVEFLDKEL